MIKQTTLEESLQELNEGDVQLLTAGKVGGVKRRFVRNHGVDDRTELIRLRLLTAAQSTGKTTSEIAKAVKYRNATQLSLIFKGERPPPKSYQFFIDFAIACYTTPDFLMGFSPYIENDRVVAEHFSIMGGMRQMIEAQAATLTAAFVKYVATGSTPTKPIDALVDAAIGMVDAHEAFKSAVGESKYENLRGGNRLATAVNALAKALPDVSEFVKRKKIGEREITDVLQGKKGVMRHLCEESQRQYALDLAGELEYNEVQQAR